MEGVVYWPPGNDETDGEGGGAYVVLFRRRKKERDGELMKWRHYRCTRDTKPTTTTILAAIGRPPTLLPANTRRFRTHHRGLNERAFRAI